MKPEIKLFNFDTKAEIDTVSFGRVKVGESKTIKVIVKNDSTADMEDIGIVVNSKEVTIDSFPKTLNVNEESIITLTYTPQIEIQKGLNTNIKVSGLLVYQG